MCGLNGADGGIDGRRAPFDPERRSAGAGGALRMAALGSRTNCTSTGECQKSRAISVMRPENWLLTQSSLKRFGAAMLSVFAAASKETGANGLIHVTYCWGVNSRSNNADSVARNRSSSRCRYGCTAHPSLLLSRERNEARSSRTERLQTLVPQRFAGSSVPERQAGFLDVRRDSNAKSMVEVELSTGPINGLQHGSRPDTHLNY